MSEEAAVPGLVAFDLDGTLLDTPRAIVTGFAATFARLGVEDRDPQEIRATIGRPLEDAFAQLLGAEPDSPLVGRAVGQYQQVYREQIVPKAAGLLFPGVSHGLAVLARHGYRLAVATNKYTASAQALLSAAGIRQRFALIVGADAVTKPKPHAEAALLISRVLGVGPDRAVVVGDTTHDVDMARNAGMRSVAVTYGVHDTAQLKAAEPTWLADSFDAAMDCILQPQ